MRLYWNEDEPGLLSLDTGSRTLRWPINEWARIFKSMAGSGLGKNPNLLFEPINRYWAQRGDGELKQWEELYEEAFAVLEGFHNNAGMSAEYTPHAVINKLRDIISTMFHLTRYESFTAMCKIERLLAFENGVKETLGEIDHAGITYFTQPYEDLMVFAAWLKVLIPIWGYFHVEMTKPLGTPTVHIRATDLLRSPGIENTPAWLKLVDYVDNFVALKIDTPGFTLTSGIGAEEIPDYLLSLLVIKKIAPYCGASKADNIVIDLFSLLHQRCEEINKSTVKGKNEKNDSGSELDIASQYKKIQPITTGVNVILERQAAGFELLVLRAIERRPAKFSPGMNNYDAWFEKQCRYIDKHFATDVAFSDFHIPLAAIALNGVFSGRSLELVTRSALVSAIKASAIIYRGWGYEEIAELLIRQPREADIFTLTVSTAGSTGFLPVHKEILMQLEDLYPYRTQGKNPGLAMIDKIIKDVQRYDWDIHSPRFHDLRTHIAELLLYVTTTHQELNL